MSKPDIKFPVAENSDYSTNLNELLKKIISLDKEGREITAHAEDTRKAAEAKVAEQVKQLRAEYMESTNSRIGAIEQEERRRGEAQLKSQSEKNAAAKEHLEQLFKENGETWAQEIFERTIAD